jgi:hypothetical protein
VNLEEDMECRRRHKKKTQLQISSKNRDRVNEKIFNMEHVNVLNLHKIDLARKYYTHLQREIEKEEAR